MISYNDRHQAFIEEIRSGIKEFETNVAADGDMSADKELFHTGENHCYAATHGF